MELNQRTTWCQLIAITIISTKAASFLILSQQIGQYYSETRSRLLSSSSSSPPPPSSYSDVRRLSSSFKYLRVFGGDDHDINSKDGYFDSIDTQYYDRTSSSVGGYPDEFTDTRRREVIASLLSVSSLHGMSTPPTAQAKSNINSVDDIGTAPMLAMDDITRQIRTSVVRGAQLIDKVDGKWERFSDNMGLGNKRNLPKRNVIDVGGNVRSKAVVRSEDYSKDEGYKIEWNEKLASGILQLCDEAFLSCLRTQQPTTAITMDEMHQQIENTKQLTRKSFFPSSSSSSSSTTASKPSDQLEFNFDCYAHFKVYNEILIKSKVNFPPFQKEYNSKIGKILFHLVQEQSSQQPLPTTPPRSSTDLVECIQNALHTTDSIASFLQRHGLIETWERSIPPSEDIEDFSTLSSDLTYSLALNGDITLNSQLLLQELGYRMYPALGRWLIYEGVSQCFNNLVADEDGRDAVRVQIDDYYMDTNYNSNPDLFEVKQTLLSIVIQRD